VQVSRFIEVGVIMALPLGVVGQTPGVPFREGTCLGFAVDVSFRDPPGVVEPGFGVPTVEKGVICLTDGVF
jgi:hypothetical protein